MTHEICRAKTYADREATLPVDQLQSVGRLFWQHFSPDEVDGRAPASGHTVPHNKHGRPSAPQPFAAVEAWPRAATLAI